MQTKIKWKRLIWVIFIYLYSGLFFYNFLNPYSNWHLVYVYTMFLIVWLGVEYYEKHLFFQSGLLRYFNWSLRTFFALFFYSSFIVGLATLVWWQDNKINFYPFGQIVGIALFIYSIILRRRALAEQIITQDIISTFYLSLCFLTISVVLAYGSIFLIPYAIFIGFPLILLQYNFEKKHYKRFEEFVHNKEQISMIKIQQYDKLWDKYLDRLQKKSKNRNKK